MNDCKHKHAESIYGAPGRKWCPDCGAVATTQRDENDRRAPVLAWQSPRVLAELRIILGNAVVHGMYTARVDAVMDGRKVSKKIKG